MRESQRVIVQYAAATESYATDAGYEGAQQAVFWPLLRGLGARLLPYVPAAATLGYNAARLRLDQTLTKPTVFNPALHSALNSLFRSAQQIPGGLAGAIRHTARTGELVGRGSGSTHVQAGVDRFNQLTRVLRAQDLNLLDRLNTQVLRNDLAGALFEAGVKVP